ncbi:unnamed protein product [Schistosoma rodhaini]|uniref:Uncharacterized protein n=1 Tax=Schistosoma rodhaini TaxID=6188 RepID=A0AA85FB29_9TREM|nr:unnamed protein product [Schistosoma rodhaini]CAH8494811.1 unnamed protein product [Schistosoma rodhaini]
MKIVEEQTEIDALVKLKGGPEGNLSWDPEPTLPIIPMVRSQSWELSTLIFDTCFYFILTIIILGKVVIIYRKFYKLCNYLLRRLIFIDTTSSMEPEDWNKTHIHNYTSNIVEYIQQSPETYKLFIEDYKELLKILNFIDEYSRE